jgi:hypothetical protein
VEELEDSLEYEEDRRAEIDKEREKLESENKRFKEFIESKPHLQKDWRKFTGCEPEDVSMMSVPK